jgi:uncharacterized protein with FMN-binding domain
MDRPLPLPRAITVVVVTIAALALIVSFRVVPHIQKGRLAAVRPAGRSAPAPAAPVPAPPRSKHATVGAVATVTRRVTGSPIDTQYGVVQVRVTLRGRRIVSIASVALPFDRSRSQEISQIAGPLLRTEALKAQSARIDVVSGATYTSNGYAQSLQSALDRAHA